MYATIAGHAMAGSAIQDTEWLEEANRVARCWGYGAGKKIANRLGVSAAAVSRMLSGAKALDARNMLRVSQILGIRPPHDVVDPVQARWLWALEKLRTVLGDQGVEDYTASVEEGVDDIVQSASKLAEQIHRKPGREPPPGRESRDVGPRAPGGSGPLLQ